MGRGPGDALTSSWSCQCCAEQESSWASTGGHSASPCAIPPLLFSQHGNRLGTLSVLHKTEPTSCKMREQGSWRPPVIQHKQTVHRDLPAAGHIQALGSLRDMRQLPRGHVLHLWLGRTNRSLSPQRRETLASCLPSARPFLKPFHLTKYLHEMAIRLPRFNEN